MKSSFLTLGILLAACQPGAHDMGSQAARHDDTATREQKTQATTEQQREHDGTRIATSADGTRIAFEKTGRGPALIVVSGALSQRSLYRDQPLVPTLAEHFTVTIYDRRGRGQSSDVQPYSVDREIEDIEALLDDAGGSAFVYGVSSGAALALQAAAKAGPARVTKLAIYDAPYGQEQQEFSTQKQRVNELVQGGVPGEAAAFFLSAIGTPPEALEGMKRSPDWDVFKRIDRTLPYDYAVLGDGEVPQDLVRTIRVPTLVMSGEKSIGIMAPTADRIAALIPDSQRKTLKGQAHQAEAEVLVPVLVEFFTGPTRP
jgi:pimeloyl-ACP methyl ester carboxylesterase